MESVILLVIAVGLAFGVGCLGRTRKIGFGLAFVISLFNGRDQTHVDQPVEAVTAKIEHDVFVVILAAVPGFPLICKTRKSVVKVNRTSAFVANPHSDTCHMRSPYMYIINDQPFAGFDCCSISVQKQIPSSSPKTSFAIS